MIKKSYTSIIDGTTIFKADEFSEMFLYKGYWKNSYTKFTNKIGLTSSGKFIDESTDVVLDFPYKDTVLKAGMSKEDVEKDDLKPDEPFLNETLARPEIDELFEPKILVNAKKYDKDGDHKVTEFSEKDNLIIKGNNLIALHSLEKRYAGKVKLIYLDPPYYFKKAKRLDSFSYNSNFKASTWLTFMKNRLEIAKKLLTNDGVLLVSMGEDGQAYLKILLDQVFGNENFVETFLWRNTDNADSLSKQSRSGIEYIHAYQKVRNKSERWKGKYSENGDAPLLNKSNGVGVRSFESGSVVFNIEDGTYKAGNYGNVELISSVKVINGKNANTFKMKGNFKWSQKTIEDEIKKGTYFIIKTTKFSIRFQRRDASIMAPEKWIDIPYLSKIFNIGSNEDASKHLDKLNISFTNSKPESLISFFIRAITQKKDIVLDFFMGSGTTQAAAMKMGRRFIGIEQMDYINTVSVPRLQKVIDGEQGGISKDVNWQGGGSFVYAELMEKNQGYLNDVLNAQNSNELNKVYDRMKDNVDFDFRVDLDSFEKDKDKLSFEDQRDMLVKIIDKNQLYYNEANIDDENLHDILSDDDFQFNKSFYGKEDDLNA